MSKEPRYWGSWKGRVVKAIAIDRAQTWSEIRDHTGLTPDTLNKVLSELYDAKVIEKDKDSKYWVSKPLYKEYKKYFDSQVAPKESVKIEISEDEQRDLISWIDNWRKVKGLDFSLKPGHFYLEGRFLDDISKDLISNAKSEVIVVNPFVDKCGLSDTLRDAAQAGKKVRLVTRPPKDEKKKYHDILKGDKVRIFHNDDVHAKLIVVDRKVAIASSMNFYAGSSGGKSWEAGIVSIEDAIVETIVRSILDFIDKKETMEI
jgi:phosphatidylserine/phosphatidylglycerophosphate/cardiolipin synthase-like enzyme